MINYRHVASLCLALFLAISGNWLLHSSSPKSESSSLASELSEKLLRFRVLANSDSSSDQFQKNQLSQELVSLLRPLLTDCTSKEEALLCLNANLSYIEEQANELAASYGAPYHVTCTLSSHLFPVKIYQNLTFPAGTYDTLLVTIGSGLGSNWWCLAYPPLCFASEAYVAVPSSTDNTLQEILDDETYKALSDTRQRAKSHQANFCFRLFPFLNKWVN